MAGQKFTPYALTALPQPSERDVNGIYFIRTPTGMKVYAISNDIKKSEVELEVEGEFDSLTIESQIRLKKLEFFIVSPNDHIAIQANKPTNLGGKSFLTIQNKGDEGEFYSCYLYFPTNGNTMIDVPETTTVTKLMLKWEFEINSTVQINANVGTITYQIQTYIDDWDSSLIDELIGKSWDITWMSGVATNRQFRSLKDEYVAATPTRGIYISLTTSGAVIINVSAQLSRPISIPAGAKLIFY